MNSNISKKVLRVLVYRLGSIGDTVVALPCFNQLRRSFPYAEITLLTSKPIVGKAAPCESVLKSGVMYDHVIHYSAGLRNPLKLCKLYKCLVSGNFDMLVNLSEDRGKVARIRDRLFFTAAGIFKQIGYRYQEQTLPTETYVPRVSVRLANRISKIGRPDLNLQASWDLGLTEQEQHQAEQQLSGLKNAIPFLALAIGTKMDAKDWGLSNWIQLVQEFSRRHGNWNLVLIGSREDFELSNEVGGNWTNGQVLNLCGLATPRVSAAVIQRCQLFIGLDSGPMHLAAAVGTPVVAIFSARSKPMEWFPRGQYSKAIYHQTDCYDCGLEVCVTHQKKCLTSISVVEVIAEAECLINQTLTKKLLAT